ncbi:hypothetical protein [Spirosoma endbachense]|uniref:Uncharacterized protein n=1 Tax=Spirosoma endbachense TaxID=2666025 RepID=A0A6P1VPW5_9BACT|nr:hypothetical protein [Spirosoma endbachense]QHV93649.1 hypothetical protein GJR95_00745 [Spirosoma endbachense]
MNKKSVIPDGFVESRLFQNRLQSGPVCIKPGVDVGYDFANAELRFPDFIKRGFGKW